jgi:hypothetical protein
LAREELGPEPESFLEVPDSVKSRMSTMGLAWTCLKAPLRQPWGTYSIATPSFQMLERAFYLRIGGCRELARRGDFAESLLQIYMDYDPEHLALCSHWPPLGKMYFQEDLGVLEILLGSEEILEQLAPEERTELLRLLLSRYSTRKDQTGGSSTLSALTGRILLSLNFEPLVEACEADESLETFLDSPVLECTSSRYASLGEKVMESGNRYLQLHELD